MLKSEICGWEYTFIELIGKGGFGKVYKVEDALGKPAAVKMIKSSKSAKNEYMILKILDGIKGVPQVFRLYKNDGIHAIAMDYLGVNIISKGSQIDLTDLKQLSNFAYWSLKILKKIHSRGVVHNDLKPHQFLIDEKKNFSLVDFGFSKKFKFSKRHKEMKVLDCKKGNFMFASINCHKSFSLSRRDDLSSLGYMLVYLFKKTLPWENFFQCENSSEKWQRTLELKESLGVKKLCVGMPDEFSRLIEHGYELDFKTRPDYQMLLGMFKDLRKKLSFPKVQKSMDSTFLYHSMSSTCDTFAPNHYSLLNDTEIIGAPEIRDRSKLKL